MPRWEPGARDRLVAAAVDLYTAQGYDDTTVAQIASRAGVTKSTFFRHFADKREVLAAGQATMSRLLAEGIAAAAADASPFDAVEAGLRRAAAVMGSADHDRALRIDAAIAASSELQERDVMKNLGFAAAMKVALENRGVPDATAHIAAELGVVAFKRGFAAWIATADAGSGVEPFAPYAVAALRDLRVAGSALGWDQHC